MDADEYIERSSERQRKSLGFARLLSGVYADKGILPNPLEFFLTAHPRGRINPNKKPDGLRPLRHRFFMDGLSSNSEALDAVC